MIFLSAVCFLLVAPAAAAAIYHAALAIAALVGRRPAAQGGTEALHTFAIIIPAHDEESAIGATLRCCTALDYPPDRFAVFVIADNCSDGTVRAAREHGAACLERSETRLRGKGHALSWAFERILPQGYDAVVVLDADCTLDPQALRAFDRRLGEGDRALQANDVASNPDDSAISYAAAVANYLENDLFYAPKSRLGLAVFLRGTGMVLHRSVLEAHPWNAASIAEDTEYTLQLIRDNIRVRFVPEVYAASPFPTDGRQLSVQRARWVGGNLSFSRTKALSLLREGLARRNPLLADAGWTLLIVVRSLIVLWVAAAMAATGALAYLAPSPITIALFSAGSISAALLAAYATLGILQFGLSWRRLGFLAQLPLSAARMIGIAAIGAIGVGPDRWVRGGRAEGKALGIPASGPTK